MKHAYLDGNQVIIRDEHESSGEIVKKERLFFTREDYAEYVKEQSNNQNENDK
ncbi:hypothetical protein SRRS_06420 [Sporomusa rhizae]|uniref:hypothetical protein n=1 Tax=Sporomusa rhizae TaxID=357999 RepID=UPI00352ADA12